MDAKKDSKTLLIQCLAGKHRNRDTITAKTVYNYIISPFLVWCDRFAPWHEREPLNAFLHLLFERGIEHEERVAKELYPQAEKLVFRTFEEGFGKVLKNCFAGVSALRRTPIFYLPENLFGIFDLLLRDDSHGSVFGQYHYVVKEVKHAKHIRKEYIFQTAFYNYLLGLVQGYTPKKFFLINRDREEFSFNYGDYHDELMEILKQIRLILSGRTRPSPTAKAAKWPWEAYTLKRALAEDDVSLVPNVGPVLKARLNAAGIFTVKQLATTSIALPDVRPSTLNKIKLSAQAMQSRKPIILEKPKLPVAKTEFFVDFEGTDEFETEEGLVRADYLIGVLHDDKYTSFFAKDFQAEKEMFERFTSFMEKFSRQDFIIYHYGPYEPHHLGLLGQKYGVDVSFITNRMVDLLKLAKKSVVFPTLSNSLKDVGSFLGFKWRGLEKAEESIVLYTRYLETRDEALLKQLLSYNEDDVRATKVIKEWLASLDKNTN